MMAGQPSGPSVLVVEGQRSLHPVIAQVLARAGLNRVNFRDTSAKALQDFLPPDALLIDARDGRQDLDSFSQLTGEARANGAVVVLMATSTDRGSLFAIREGLCDVILLKPFIADEVRRKLESQQLLLPPKPKLRTRSRSEVATIHDHPLQKVIAPSRDTVSI
ncbi:response regulator [Chthonobacter albigriseus]|uniref:response regulator n=1 Tax=Chthonobacter albigriseus TaxID=1683161 RepID=UPI0015EFBF8D|nr:response regulator [Chthonobacter albigriseus]